jgi:hypothetical protein
VLGCEAHIRKIESGDDVVAVAKALVRDQ